MEDINRSFAALIVTQVCAVQPGERVLIELTDPDEGMGAELIRAVHRVGGRPFYHQMRDALEAAWISCADEDTIRHQADWDRQRMEQMDVFISLRRSENPCDMTEVPVEQAQLYRSLYTRPVHFETRLPHTRWLAMALPSPAMAQAAGMSTRDLYQFYYDSCLIDYRQFHRRMMPLAELMTQTDQVRITGPQLELQFSVRDMGVSICHGTRNIPAGEVFTAPVPDSVEGHIRYNVPTRWEGQLFTGVTLIFSRGRIVDASCEIGDRERLMQILDTDAGARHIGEFAMGTNPFIHRITSDILFDEKAAGSFHFTPGNSYGPSNKSRIHWDMVRRMQPEYGGGGIYFDGVLVQRDGLFVLPELLPLNPENLKRELSL